MKDGILSLAGFMCSLLLTCASAPAAYDEPAQTPSETVTEEEYHIYDEVVRSKFLTTSTVLVVIERMTTNRLLPPDPDQPEMTGRTFFETRELFDSRLSPELIGDFLFTNHKPARLASRFGFGVPYRFMSSSGEPESDVFISDPEYSVRPVRLIQEARTIDRLSFSRVGFAPRRAEALVYVANDRPDGSGAGFLVWLRARESSWNIVDTEVVWTARTQNGLEERP